MDSLYKLLGKFVAEFQGVESALKELVTLMSGGDDYVLATLMSKMDFSHLNDSANVIYAWYVEVGRFPETETEKADTKAEFYALRNRCKDLSELRNGIVHSSYTPLIRDDGEIALVRANPRPKFKGGARLDENEQDVTAADFRRHIEETQMVRREIEAFRRLIVNWKYPEN
jgi:hypothetical protein